MKFYDEEFIELLEPLQKVVPEKENNRPVVVFGSRVRYLDEMSFSSSGASSENEDENVEINATKEESLKSSRAFDKDNQKILRETPKRGLSCIYLPFKNKLSSNNAFASIPTAVLPPDIIERTDIPINDVSTYLLDTGMRIMLQPIVILLIRSGRFAGGVFVKEKCVEHRVCQRYTIRRGQGGSQKNNDNSKGKAKSIGAQLRRAGEIALQEDIKETLQNWSKLINESALIFLSCPNVMKKDFFDACMQANISLKKTDARIRRVPIDTKRPSFDAVCQVHDKLMSVSIVEDLEATQNSKYLLNEEESIKERNTNMRKNPDKASDSNEGVFQTTDNAPQIQQNALSELHIAAQMCDMKRTIDLLRFDKSDIDCRVGDLEWTPLHYAAASTGHDAADCVKLLLVTGHANPCIVDSHNRPPFFVSSTTKVKEAFRTARAELGESFTDWDRGAKVGPALTLEMIKVKKEKEIEKKRRQKERQRKQKLANKEEEKRQLEIQENKQREEKAARLKAGLHQISKPNTCDLCSKQCKRSQMFVKLSYKYCSTECVKKHQRILMAEAAMRRNQG